MSQIKNLIIKNYEEIIPNNLFVGLKAIKFYEYINWFFIFNKIDF